MLRSLGLRSDLLAMTGLSEVESHADRVVMRTPSEPDFWFGNTVIFRDQSTSARDAIAQFRADFPDAQHICLQWDVPDMVPGAVEDDLRQRGLEVDQGDVLTLTGALVRHDGPSGITMRELSSDDDWAQAEALQCATGIAQGYDPERHPPFVAARMAARRRQVRDGLGQWFGAFDGDLLVADMGVMTDGAIARYQSVETRPSHRRQGICAALVCHAADWIAAHAPDAIPVIVADRDAPPGRIYRSCGFTLHEVMTAAALGSYAPDVT